MAWLRKNHFAQIVVASVLALFAGAMAFQIVFGHIMWMFAVLIKPEMVFIAAAKTIWQVSVLVPFLCAVAVTEIFRWRSKFIWLAFGAAAPIWPLAQEFNSNMFTRPGNVIFVVALSLACAGAGLLYWAIAGHNAGNWNSADELGADAAEQSVDEDDRQATPKRPSSRNWRA